MIVPVGAGDRVKELVAQVPAPFMPDVELEVREHKYALAGHAYIMRHPDEFQVHFRFEIPWGVVAGEEALPAS